MYSLAQVEDFCNKVRKAGGAKPLNGLLPGVPQDSESCLIANNLNFECEVGPYPLTSEQVGAVSYRPFDDDNQSWVMWVHDEETRDRIAETIGLVPLNTNDAFGVILPGDLAEVARRFDVAWDIAEKVVYDYLDTPDGALDWEHVSVKQLEAHMDPDLAQFVRYFEGLKDTP